MDVIEIAERYRKLCREYEILESDIEGFLEDRNLEDEFIAWKEFRREATK